MFKCLWKQECDILIVKKVIKSRWKVRGVECKGRGSEGSEPECSEVEDAVLR